MTTPRKSILTIVLLGFVPIATLDAQRPRRVPADELQLLESGDSLSRIGGERRLRDALATFARGESLSTQRGDPLMRGQFLMRQGTAHIQLGDSATGVRFYRAGAAQFESIQHSNLTYALRLIARWHWRAGQLDSASAVYERAYAFETQRREPDRIMVERLRIERDSLAQYRRAPPRRPR